MDDAEYNRLWAKIDKAHTRIGYLESEKDMLISVLNELIDCDDGNDDDVNFSFYRAKRLLETMKGE